MAKILKEYVITLKNKEDLDQFYIDMETNNYKVKCIPKRGVSCSNRRNVSRSTNYMLTESEAETLRNDERVLSVELTIEEQGIELTPQFIQEEVNNWAKNSQQNSNHKNWALLRLVRGDKISNWGSNGTNSVQSGKIVVAKEGRGVDVVLVDGHTDPDHPEFKTNPDGSGQSRLTNFNWLQYNSIMQSPIASGNYVYPPYTGTDNNHGAHVFGILAGNTNGWARSSRLLHMSPYSTNPNVGFSSVLWDYIRVFHDAKQINIETGIKKPTVTNHSYGTFLLKAGAPYPLQELADTITEISFRGQTLLPPFTTQILLNCGIVPIAGNAANGVSIPIRVASIDADVEDAILEGVIVVGAAGNSSFKIDVEGGIDYDNSFVLNGIRRFYHRGSSPTAARGAICVGSVSSLLDERKSSFSNCGPRVDIYAPGDFITSSVNEQLIGTVQDSRNPAFYLQKISGTSMASPQVCGIIATVLETYPNLNQAGVLEYLTRKGSKSDQILNSIDSFSNPISLQGSSNKYVYYYPERAATGKLSPKTDFFVRSQNGVVYPRLRKRRRNEN